MQSLVDLVPCCLTDDSACGVLLGLQVVVFMYYGFQLDRWVLQVSSPSYLKGPLPYHPQLRSQAWRYLSYAFMHTGWGRLWTHSKNTVIKEQAEWAVCFREGCVNPSWMGVDYCSCYWTSYFCCCWVRGPAVSTPLTMRRMVGTKRQIHTCSTFILYCSHNLMPICEN